MTARSSPPEDFMPALTPEARNPRGTCRVALSIMVIYLLKDVTTPKPVRASSGSTRRVAPVNEQCRAGHEAGGFRSQEHGRRPEFDRIPPAGQRDVGLH